MSLNKMWNESTTTNFPGAELCLDFAIEVLVEEVSGVQFEDLGL